MNEISDKPHALDLEKNDKDIGKNHPAPEANPKKSNSKSRVRRRKRDGCTGGGGTITPVAGVRG